MEFTVTGVSWGDLMMRLMSINRDLLEKKDQRVKQELMVYG